MSEMPEIDIQLMPTDNPAKGIGEASLPLIAPCVGNALFKLTGKALPRAADVAGAGEGGYGGLVHQSEGKQKGIMSALLQ